MPYYRKRRKSYRRRTRKFRGRGRKLIGFIKRRLTKRITKTKIRGYVIPDETWVKLKYLYYMNLTNSGTGTSTAIQIFRGNSLFDPDQSGTGTQPMGYDQWSALYSLYYVAASKIKCTIASVSANNSGTIFTIFPSLDTFDPVTSLQKFIQAQPAAYSKYLMAPAQGNGNTAKMKMYMTTNKMWGSRDTENDDLFQSATTTSSTRAWYWNLSAQNIAGTLNVSQVNGIVEITYYAKMFRRTTMDPS